ncbi:hypothetical protein CKO29_16575 [Allochromatium vinosum]|nr:hypothetical protein [Allochromatium vinosum]
MLGAAEGLFWGVVFLFVAFVVLPSFIIDHVLKRLRPDWVSRTRFVGKVKLAFDYIINHKDVVISSGSDERQKKKEQEINDLLQEKRRLENNLFFLDMLKSLSSMLFFSVSRSGHNEDTAIEIIEQAMEYLMHYGNNLQDTEGSQNQRDRIYRAADDLNKKLVNLVDFKRTTQGDEVALLIAKNSLRQGLASFDFSMKKEYDSTRSQLGKLNQLLGVRLMEFVEAQ